MVLGIYEDGIVRARRHACFAADADRLIEVDNAVRSLEHRSCRAGGHTRCVSTLITASDLMRAAHLRKRANVNVFDICARHR